jgi:hypothetical protein
MKVGLRRSIPAGHFRQDDMRILFQTTLESFKRVEMFIIMLRTVPSLSMILGVGVPASRTNCHKVGRHHQVQVSTNI